MKNLCAPSQVFIVLAVISVIVYLINLYTKANIKTIDVTDYMYKTDAIKNAYMALAVKVVMLVLYGYFLQVLCNNKLDKVAWVVLFYPFLVIGFITLYSSSIGLLSVIRGGKNSFKVGALNYDDPRDVFARGVDNISNALHSVAYDHDPPALELGR